jgi:hypothetical protein
MQFARYVFYFEAIAINLLTGLIAFFAPGWFLSNFSSQTIPPVPLELLRWYGVLLFVFAYVMLRALPSGNVQAVAFLVEGFLLGDIVHLVASVLFLRAGGVVNLAVVFMFAMSTFLAGVRIFWLTRYYRGVPRRAG